MGEAPGDSVDMLLDSGRHGAQRKPSASQVGGGRLRRSARRLSMSLGWLAPRRSPCRRSTMTRTRSNSSGNVAWSLRRNAGYPGRRTTKYRGDDSTVDGATGLDTPGANPLGEDRASGRGGRMEVDVVVSSGGRPTPFVDDRRLKPRWWTRKPWRFELEDHPAVWASRPGPVVCIRSERDGLGRWSHLGVRQLSLVNPADRPSPPPLRAPSLCADRLATAPATRHPPLDYHANGSVRHDGPPEQLVQVRLARVNDHEPAPRVHKRPQRLSRSRGAITWSNSVVSDRHGVNEAEPETVSCMRSAHSLPSCCRSCTGSRFAE